MILKEFLNSISDLLDRYPARIYSIRNHSVVGSIINSKELIPENVYGYKYLSIKLEENSRMKGKYVIVITVE